ncbi:hypothetical protein HerbRD11066_40030 [Herbidospora sp. RD11066]
MLFAQPVPQDTHVDQLDAVDTGVDEVFRQGGHVTRVGPKRVGRQAAFDPEVAFEGPYRIL